MNSNKYFVEIDTVSSLEVQLKLFSFSPSTDSASNSRIGGFSTKKFAERLTILGLGKGNFSEFNNYGKNTYFIPIDSAFEVNLR